MKPEALVHVVHLAQVFINKAQAVIERAKTDSFAKYGCKQTAAAKRASMDLTRALAEMRKS